MTGNKVVTLRQLERTKIIPYSGDDLARLNALLEPATWGKRQRDLHSDLALAFGVLGRTKAELVAAARANSMVGPLKSLVKQCHLDAEWLKAAADFFEGAEVRLMVAFAASVRPLEKDKGSKAVKRGKGKPAKR
jgi:hypothetical protein